MRRYPFVGAAAIVIVASAGCASVPAPASTAVGGAGEGQPSKPVADRGSASTRSARTKTPNPKEGDILSMDDLAFLGAINNQKLTEKTKASLVEVKIGDRIYRVGTKLTASDANAIAEKARAYFAERVSARNKFKVDANRVHPEAAACCCYCYFDDDGFWTCEPYDDC
jgi:hypothetical protein